MTVQTQQIPIGGKLTSTQPQQLPIEDLSAIYDRIYDIVDMLFKKYNPCNIHTIKKSGKVVCNGRHRPTDTLCCYECSPGRGPKEPHYWDNGCTIKCLGCKLFLCEAVRNKHPLLNRKLSKLRGIAYKYNLPSGRCYFPKEDWLKLMERKQ